MLASTVLALTGPLLESPWEDEFSSMRALDRIHGYRFMPAYFVYLKTGFRLGGDLFWLRIWSFLPWLPGLFLAHRFLIRLGARRGDALATAALLAVNPFLLQECTTIRYYAFFFFAAMCALHALVFLIEGGGSRAARLGACFLLLLPQLTVYSGLALLVVAGVQWVWRGRSPWSPPSLTAMGTLASIALCLVAFPLLRLLPPIERLSLPLSLGFARAEADVWSLAYQYNKLLGWNYLSWHVPPHWVEGASFVLVLAAGVHLAREHGELRHRSLLLTVALVPVAVWLLSPVVNVLGTRYYLYASVPVTFMVVVFARSLWQRHRLVGALAPLTVLGLSAASSAISYRVPANPPLFALERSLREHEITALSVFPPWYAPCVEKYFEWRGVSIPVDSWLAPPRLEQPEWIFFKDPGFTAPSRSVWLTQRENWAATLAIAQYREVERFQCLKKYYFHGVRLTDHLLRKKTE